MKELGGRTAVVTGGGSGIGRGICLALAGRDMNVVVADIEADAAQGVAKELTDRGARAIAQPVDVTDEASLDALRDAAFDAFGTVQLLSNNAGVILPMEPLAAKSAADWEYVFSVNVFGIVKSVQAFLPHLIEQGEGHIVNTASMAGLVALSAMPIGIYTASKYACVGYSEMLRGELEGTGVGVSVLCPGMVASNLTATSARNRPAAYGGPADSAAAEAPAEIQAQMMPAETCGEIVARGVEHDLLHILTHPGARAMVEARFEALQRDFDAAERNVP